MVDLRDVSLCSAFHSVPEMRLSRLHRNWRTLLASEALDVDSLGFLGRCRV